MKMELDGQGRYPLWVYERFLFAAEGIPGYRGFCGNLCIVINSIEKFLCVDAKTLQDTHEEMVDIIDRTKFHNQQAVEVARKFPPTCSPRTRPESPFLCW